MRKKRLSPSSVCMRAHAAPALTSRFTAHRSLCSTAENAANVSCGEAGSPQEPPPGPPRSLPVARQSAHSPPGSLPLLSLGLSPSQCPGHWPSWGCSSCGSTGTIPSEEWCLAGGVCVLSFWNTSVSKSQYPKAGGYSEGLFLNVELMTFQRALSACSSGGSSLLQPCCAMPWRLWTNAAAQLCSWLLAATQPSLL